MVRPNVNVNVRLILQSANSTDRCLFIIIALLLLLALLGLCLVGHPFNRRPSSHLASFISPLDHPAISKLSAFVMVILKGHGIFKGHVILNLRDILVLVSQIN